MKVKRFTVLFNCKQFGASHPDVCPDSLDESKDEINKGLNAHETYSVQLYDGDKERFFCAPENFWKMVDRQVF